MSRFVPISDYFSFFFGGTGTNGGTFVLMICPGILFNGSWALGLIRDKGTYIYSKINIYKKSIKKGFSLSRKLPS